MTPVWAIRLSSAAERDFVWILRATRDRFGTAQATIYRHTLTAALAALAEGPYLQGSAARDEILPGLRSLHVARQGHRGRHFVMYRVSEGAVIEIIRILHDGMDFGRHIPGGDA